jgi:hypothetical protein
MARKIKGTRRAQIAAQEEIQALRESWEESRRYMDACEIANGHLRNIFGPDANDAFAVIFRPETFFFGEDAYDGYTAVFCNAFGATRRESWAQDPYDVGLDLLEGIAFDRCSKGLRCHSKGSCSFCD